MDIFRDKLYRIYNHINYRCYNESCESYHRYGGRGIINEFKSFDEFYSYLIESFKDHVNKYGFYNTTIERINNNDNYKVGNVTWATRKEQAANRSTSRYFIVTSTIDSNYKWLVNDALGFCKRVGISWTTFKTLVQTHKIGDEFFIDEIDKEEYDMYKCNMQEFQNTKILVYGYRLTSLDAKQDFVVRNLKATCRNLGIDPSAAYKCVKGTRSTCGDYMISKIKALV